MNPAIQGTFSVMHYSSEANYDEFVYGAYQIIENSSAPFTINGTVITSPVAAQMEGQVVPMLINGNTTAANSDLLLFGNPKSPNINVKTGEISGATETFQNNIGIVETYQYIDIKTGKPIKS